MTVKTALNKVITYAITRIALFDFYFVNIKNKP